MKMQLNKVYKLELGDLSHCGLSHEEMIEHYKSNSSPMSFLSEKILPNRFDSLVYDPTPQLIEHNGTAIKIKPDLRDKQTRKILYDQKAFSDKGGDFTRSSMKGIGRVFDKELNEAWARAQIFIWTDFCDLPMMRVIALTGEECLTRWPKGKIKRSQRENLFSE